MSGPWLRRSSSWRERLGAALVATGVAAATYYVTRTLLSRDPLPETPHGDLVTPETEQPEDGEEVG